MRRNDFLENLGTCASVRTDPYSIVCTRRENACVTKKPLSTSKVFGAFSKKPKEIEQEREKQGLYRQLKNNMRCSHCTLNFDGFQHRNHRVPGTCRDASSSCAKMVKRACSYPLQSIFLLVQAFAK